VGIFWITVSGDAVKGTILFLAFSNLFNVFFRDFNYFFSFLCRLIRIKNSGFSGSSPLSSRLENLTGVFFHEP
jgi:hypothetical protein